VVLAVVNYYFVHKVDQSRKQENKKNQRQRSLPGHPPLLHSVDGITDQESNKIN